MRIVGPHRNGVSAVRGREEMLIAWTAENAEQRILRILRRRMRENDPHGSAGGIPARIAFDSANTRGERRCREAVGSLHLMSSGRQSRAYREALCKRRDRTCLDSLSTRSHVAASGSSNACVSLA